jgi:hypothetical protein
MKSTNIYQRLVILGIFLTISFISILGVSLRVINTQEEPKFMTIYTNLSMYHVDIKNLTIHEENWDGEIKFKSYRALTDSLENITANDVNISTSIPSDCWVNQQTFLGLTTLEVVTCKYNHRIIIGTVEYTKDMGWTYYPNCVDY